MNAERPARRIGRTTSLETDVWRGSLAGCLDSGPVPEYVSCENVEGTAGARIAVVAQDAEAHIDQGERIRRRH